MITLLALAIAVGVVVKLVARGRPAPEGVDETFWKHNHHRPRPYLLCKHNDARDHCPYCRHRAD